MDEASKLITRRDFVKTGVLAGAGACLVPHWALAGVSLKAAAPCPPHFFLQILVPGGMDASYLFDARPLAMTQAGLIQNYLAADPSPMTGANGGSCLATSLVGPLRPYLSRFTVLNGVLMAMGFDGHDQNLNFLLAGDPFGGEFFVPHLNCGSKLWPVDGIQSGIAPGTNLTNTGGMVPLSADSAQKLVDGLKAAAPLDPASALYGFIRSRLVANSSGAGAFSAGAKAMLAGYDEAPALAAMLKTAQVAGGERVDDLKFTDLAMEFFRKGVTRSAMLAINQTGSIVDTHDPTNAKLQPKLFAELASRFAAIIGRLAETPFDPSQPQGQSMLDVTTVVIASEFSRTMRQKMNPMDNTGTDHNPLSNTILVGGKGIRGGQIIGASDRASAAETLSKAHQLMDPEDVKVMGRPFDFATMEPRTDLPQDFAATDYLTVASVVNTLYSLFEVDATHYRKLGRNLPVARQIPGLIG